MTKGGTVIASFFNCHCERSVAISRKIPSPLTGEGQGEGALLANGLLPPLASLRTGLTPSRQERENRKKIGAFYGIITGKG